MIEPQFSLYTIYQSPSEFPGKFVIRKWTLVNGEPAPEKKPLAVCSSLEEARMRLPAWLKNIGREPKDDPVIVETWL